MVYNLEIEQWRILNENDTTNLEMKIKHGFLWACFNCNLEAAMWFISISNDDHLTIENAGHIIEKACLFGRLYFAQWFYKKYETIIDITERNHRAFRVACERGHLEIAQWLLSIAKPNPLYGYAPNLNSNPVDIYGIHDTCEDSFKVVCERGYINTAKLLLSVFPNLDTSILNHIAFRYACSKGHLELAQWICTLPRKNKPPTSKWVSKWLFRNACLGISQCMFE